MRREQIIIGLVCVFAYLMLIVPSQHEQPAQAQETEEPKPIVPEKPKTPEDYWVPLDNWLKAQGSPLSGRDFYEVGKQYHLDPDFLIAVTKAETQLCTVKQRGSQYNCGSVGSYDSTATTYATSSYRHGIEQIAQTVNNQNLARYTQISQLSRSHNKNQAPIYASSDGNWFRNVRDTMNQLKGKQEPDFLFRQ